MTEDRPDLAAEVVGRLMAPYGDVALKVLPQAFTDDT